MHGYETSNRWLTVNVLECSCTVQVDKATVSGASYGRFVVMHQSADKAVMDPISIPKSCAGWHLVIQLCFELAVNNAPADNDTFTESFRHSLSGGDQWLLETTDEMSQLSINMR